MQRDMTALRYRAASWGLGEFRLRDSGAGEQSRPNSKPGKLKFIQYLQELQDLKAHHASRCGATHSLGRRSRLFESCCAINSVTVWWLKSLPELTPRPLLHRSLDQVSD